MEAVRREVEIDTQLAELWQEAAKIDSRMDSARFSLARVAGVKPVYETKHRRVIPKSVSELLEMIDAQLPTKVGYLKTEAESAVAEWHELVAESRANREAAQPLEDIYQAEQWSRFFLVLNNGGHIHSSMQCSTCRWDTRFGWLPELSGLTEADAVESQGAILCTVCFPSAPVEWTGGISKVEQAEKDERAAAKAARDAAKAAKAIFDLDGSVLKDKGGYEIKTEVTARRELSSALQNECLGYGPDWTAYAERLAAAIANKTGESAEELLSTGRKKAAKTVGTWRVQA